MPDPVPFTMQQEANVEAYPALRGGAGSGKRAPEAGNPIGESTVAGFERCDEGSL